MKIGDEERGRRSLAGLAGAVSLAAALAANQIHDVWSAEARLPKWDEAAHGMASVRLADELRALDFIGFTLELNRNSLWPPVAPVLAAPVLLAWPATVATARGVTTATFVLTVIALFVAAVAIDPRRGAIAGAVAAGLALMSPLFVLHAALIMLEMPGALVLLLAIAAYARLARTDRGAALAFALAAALFLTKYNYGLPWLATVLAIELMAGRTRLAGLIHERRRELVAALRTPFLWFVLAYVAVVMAVVLSGGIHTTVLGQQVDFASAGNPLYALGILIALWIGASRRRRDNVAALWSGLSPRHRDLARWGLLPIVLWLAVPAHNRDFFRFLHNRSSELPATESLLFYPRSLVFDYVVAPWLGLALGFAAIFAVIAAARGRARGDLALHVALGLFTLSAILHPFKEPRFFFLPATLLYVAAGLGVARLVSERVWLRTIGAALASLFVLFAGARGIDRPRLARDFAEATLPADVAGVLDLVAEHARDGATLLGYWNGLSPDLVRWHLPSPGTPAPRRLERLSAAREPEAVVAALLDVGANPVIVVEPKDGAGPWRDSFTSECPWVAPARAALERDPRFRRTVDESRAGYRVSVFAR